MPKAQWSEGFEPSAKFIISTEPDKFLLNDWKVFVLPEDWSDEGWKQVDVSTSVEMSVGEIGITYSSSDEIPALTIKSSSSSDGSTKIYVEDAHQKYLSELKPGMMFEGKIGSRDEDKDYFTVKDVNLKEFYIIFEDDEKAKKLRLASGLKLIPLSGDYMIEIKDPDKLLFKNPGGYRFKAVSKIGEIEIVSETLTLDETPPGANLKGLSDSIKNGMKKMKEDLEQAIANSASNNGSKPEKFRAEIII